MKEKKTMVYLCVDLKNPQSNKTETYYLTKKWDLKALLKYTSYYDDANELLSSLPDYLKKHIQMNKVAPINYNTFYFKKLKSGSRFGVVYRHNEDLIYVNEKDINNVFKNKKYYLYEENITQNYYKADTVKVLKSLSQLIKGTRAEIVINNNFIENYDSDRNPIYQEFDKCELWQKIGLMDENISVAIKEICSDPIKKLNLVSNLKKINLSSDKKEEKNKLLIDSSVIEKRKVSLIKLLYLQKNDYRYIKENIKQNAKKFFGCKEKEESKEEKLVEIKPSIYVEPVDERKKDLEQRISDSSDENEKLHAINELAKYELMNETDDRDMLYSFCDLDDILKDKSK